LFLFSKTGGGNVHVIERKTDNLVPTEKPSNFIIAVSTVEISRRDDFLKWRAKKKFCGLPASPPVPGSFQELVA